MCGGTGGCRSGVNKLYGLSPRVRGNPVASGLAAVMVRSIPACAGEPAAFTAMMTAYPVYPRVCGGTAGGSQRALRAAGSIPACAGEPHRRRYRAYPTPVYPRVCGGTVGIAAQR